MQGLLGELFNSNLSPDQKAIRDQGLYAGLLNAGSALTAASSGSNNPGALFSQAAQGFVGGNAVGRGQEQQKQQMAGLLGSISDPALRMAAQANPAAYSKHLIEAKLRAQKPQEKFVTVQNPLGRGGVGQMNQATGKLVNYQAPKAGGEVPTIREFYDKDGGAYKAQWNPQTQAWDRIGGTKTGKNSRTLDGNQLINAEQKLYEQFQKQTQTERDQVGAYRRIEAIYQDPTKNDLRGVKHTDGSVFALDAPGAADLALIFNYMKMLDPGSVVREGEFALAEKTGGLPGWVKTQWEKVSSGGRLSTDMRQKIVSQSRNQFNSASRAIDRKLKASRNRAKMYTGFGVDPVRAISYSPYEPLLQEGAFANGGTTSIPVNQPTAAPNSARYRYENGRLVPVR